MSRSDLHSQHAEPATVTTEARDALLDQCRQLATAQNVLSAVTEDLNRMGVVGAEREAKLLYLVRVTRHFERPLSAVIKGPPASGKSRLLDAVVALTPQSTYVEFSGASQKAFVHYKGDLRQKHIVMKEFAGLQSQQGNAWLRQLISDGRLAYAVTMGDTAGFETQVIEVDGPCGLLMTTTEGQLHPEDESRMLSLHSDETSEQTRAILLAQVRDREGSRPALERWHALDAFIAAGTKSVVIPYGERLAHEIDPGVVQMRRYFPMVRDLIAAHALLHQLNREHDAGRIVATQADYAAVYPLVIDLITEGLQRSVAPQMRSVVDAVTSVREHRPEYLDGVPQFVVRPKVGMDKSVLSRWVSQAVGLGYLYNAEPKQGRPHRLIPGDPLPEDKRPLPTPEQLTRLSAA